MEGLNACWSPRAFTRRLRLLVIAPFSLDSSFWQSRRLRRKKRIALSSSPINPVSFCYPSVRRESKFSLTLAFQVLACRLKKKKSSPWSSLSFSLFHPSGGRFNSKRKAFSLMPPTVASSPPPLENRSSFTERRKRGTKRGRVCRSRVLKACSALRVNSRWGFHEG